MCCFLFHLYQENRKKGRIKEERKEEKKAGRKNKRREWRTKTKIKKERMKRSFRNLKCETQSFTRTSKQPRPKEERLYEGVSKTGERSHCESPTCEGSHDKRGVQSQNMWTVATQWWTNTTYSTAGKILRIYLKLSKHLLFCQIREREKGREINNFPLNSVVRNKNGKQKWDSFAMLISKVCLYYIINNMKIL